MSHASMDFVSLPPDKGLRDQSPTYVNIKDIMAIRWNESMGYTEVTLSGGRISVVTSIEAHLLASWLGRIENPPVPQ